ncbi:hypothetical protein ALC60_01845 [Trachymyrmex zeteki]|uniref:Globin domain-containing protein n=3 Tax=Formicidae TaxID=36668 RepID=A0A151XFU3_9HYME|nr:hypothetical protein ALC60_01845 [Trachymyrmex zeteki]
MGNIRRGFRTAKALGWRIRLTPLYAVAFDIDFIRRSYRQTSIPNASLRSIATLAVRKSDTDAYTMLKTEETKLNVNYLKIDRRILTTLQCNMRRKRPAYHQLFHVGDHIHQPFECPLLGFTLVVTVAWASATPDKFPEWAEELRSARPDGSHFIRNNAHNLKLSASLTSFFKCRNNMHYQGCISLDIRSAHGIILVLCNLKRRPRPPQPERMRKGLREASGTGGATLYERQVNVSTNSNEQGSTRTAFADRRGTWVSEGASGETPGGYQEKRRSGPSPLLVSTGPTAPGELRTRFMANERNPSVLFYVLRKGGGASVGSDDLLAGPGPSRSSLLYRIFLRETWPFYIGECIFACINERNKLYAFYQYLFKFDLSMNLLIIGGSAVEWCNIKSDYSHAIDSCHVLHNIQRLSHSMTIIINGIRVRGKSLILGGLVIPKALSERSSSSELLPKTVILKRRTEAEERACASFSRALVMEASVSARLGSRQHGRRRSTAPSIRPGSPGLLKRMDHIRRPGKLFEENTELLNMFTKFRDQKTKEQQSTSMELAEHAKTVMTTLDEGIKSLDDMDAFLTYLHEVGASHTKIPGFNRQYFWKIEKPFLDAVERTLEDRYSENVENIYKLTIKFIIETLIDGFDKAQSDKAKS